MKKTTLITFLLTLIVFFSFSQVQHKTADESYLKLNSFEGHKNRVHFSLDGFKMLNTMTERGEAFTIEAQNSTPLLIKGAPDLTRFSFSLIIPQHADMHITVNASEFIEYQNVNIAPSKGNLLRNTNPNDVPFEYDSYYNQNKFFPGKQAELLEKYSLRDFTGQTVHIYPFQYNPITKVLRVYYYMDITVAPKKISMPDAIYKIERNYNSIVKEFDNIYSKHFLNYKAVKSLKYIPLEEHGSMLVISHGSFMTDMAPFVHWKNTIGIPTRIVDIASIGNTPTAIKNYIQAVYDTTNLTFVLLVGDAEHIPPVTLPGWGGHSDNAYAYLTGNDSYPELFIGRFSAETSAHVQTQVQRTINYELIPSTQANLFNRAIGIASEEGPGHNNLYDHEHLRVVRDSLLAYNYIYVGEFYEGSQGGLDAPGNPTKAMIANEFNTGVGLINYTGHGWDQGWATSNFDNNNINALTNTHILPFIWSVACVNGEFVGKTCFAEAFLRASHNNQPAGAIAALMSTINQSWNPPMSGQLEMNNILTESYNNNIKRTFGGLSMNGCMKMNDDYGPAGAEMTDTWALFGDPSLKVRTNNPLNMTVTHNPSIFIGESSLLVQCSEEGAFVALTINNNIISTGVVQGGSVLLSFVPLSVIDTITVAVTAYNHIPYLGEVLIIPPSGPYVIYASYAVNDALGNNNNIPDYDENFFLDIALRNVGIHSADSVWTVLSTTSPHVIVNSNQNFWGDILADSLEIVMDAFELTLSDSVPDQFSNVLSLNVSDKNNNSWQSSFILKANAPKLLANNIELNDITGNNNNLVDAGEQVDIIIHASNIGHADIQNITAIISTTNPHITINTGLFNINALNAGDNVQTLFSITADTQTPLEEEVTLIYEIQAGAYSITKNYTFYVGKLPEFWMKDTTVYVCDAYFYDSNGPDANYGANENKIMTFYPNSNTGNDLRLRAEFLMFEVEDDDWYGGCWDELFIYNGPSVSSPLIASYCGMIPPPAVQSTHPSGALTFKFNSDPWIEWSGWKARLSCVISSDIKDINIVHFEIYPNPTENTLTIAFNEDIFKGYLSIFNAHGAVVYSETLNGDNNTTLKIDMSYFANGIYYLKFNSPSYSSVQKVVKF